MLSQLLTTTIDCDKITIKEKGFYKKSTALPLAKHRKSLNAEKAGNFMMENTTNTKKKKLKGFTLVEVIVVMVILAILAALLLPSLTGYIDKANKQGAVVEARSIYTALQTTASEMYGRDNTFRTKSESEKAAALGAEAIKTEVIDLAELTDKGTLSDIKCTKQAKITGFKWDNGVYTVIYKDGDFDVNENTGS